MLGPESQNLLYSSDIANYLDGPELEMLFHYGEIVSFSPGATILQQGKKSRIIYVLLKGTVTVVAKMLGEGTVNLGILGSGNFLGEISFIERIPSAASVIANDQVQCLVITDNYIQFISAYFPQTKYKLFNAISKQVYQRLKSMYEKNIELISNADMTPKFLFGEMIHSLVEPKKITIEAAGIDMSELQKQLQFTENEIDELFKHGDLLNVPKHYTLISKNEKKALCYIVIRGAVQSSMMHDNKIAKLSVIGPNTLFANTLCIGENSSLAITFVTCEKVILLKFSESDLNFFKENNSEICYKIFDFLCKSLVALERSIDKLYIRLKIETYNR